MGINFNDFKFSKYNHKINLEENLFLYNALSGGFCKVPSEFKNIFNSCDLYSDVNDLNSLPDFIINELIHGGFFIKKNLDEFKVIKSRHNLARFNLNNYLGLTLIPTMACNFRCVYCFEKDKYYPNKKMSEEVMDAIIKLIDTNLSDGGHLNVSWYGGEPLLNFEILKKLQIRINNLVSKKNLNFSSFIVTNGYLLTKEISDELVNLGITIAQITIDGEKETHDNKRILINGKGTFDTIVSNLKSINKNLSVAIRVNTDKNNINSIPRFMDFINTCGIGENPNIKVYFAPVVDYDSEKNTLTNTCYSIEDFSKEEIKLNKLLYEKNLDSTASLKPNFSVCGAVSPNSYIIEPDGSVQKCWNLVGSKEHITGHLIDDAKYKDLIVKNQSEWYSWSQFESSECKNCNILPLCMGGCPHYTINRNDHFEEQDYKCSTQKFNLDDTLKNIAYQYLHKSTSI